MVNIWIVVLISAVVFIIGFIIGRNTVLNVINGMGRENREFSISFKNVKTHWVLTEERII